MSDYIVGIDIGSSNIYAAAGKIDDDRELQIVGISSAKCKGVEKGKVISINEAAIGIRQCVEQIEKMIQTTIEGLYISIHGGNCEFIENKGTALVESEDSIISQKDIDKALTVSRLISVPSGKEIIGTIPIEYIVDEKHSTNNPVGIKGSVIEINSKVTMIESEIVNGMIESVNLAEKDVKGFVIDSEATSQVVLTTKQKENGVALIDVGSQTIDISIYKDNVLCYNSIIPLGGMNITKDIAICFKINNDEAEEIKVKFGGFTNEVEYDNFSSSYTTSNGNIIDFNNTMLNEIIEARVEQLFKFIKLELINNGQIDYVEELVLVGGGMSLFSGISDIAYRIFNKPIIIGTPNYLGAASPTYSNCVGIVKRIFNSSSFDESENSVSPKSTNYKLLNNEDVENEEKEDEIIDPNTGIMKKIKNYAVNLFNTRR